MTPSLITSPKHVVQIAPALALTSAQYELAAAGITEHVPALGPLRWETFISSAWTLIPDELSGEAYKAELTLSKTRGWTVKLNCWLAPDRRGGEIARPHNHPWDFLSRTLDGVLVEDRVERGDDGQLRHETGVEHRVGALNRVGRQTFHEVIDVRPGTLTLMMCGPDMSSWGYLDADGGYTDAELPAGFTDRLWELNPHQR